jgi:hypothetical protein
MLLAEVTGCDCGAQRLTITPTNIRSAARTWVRAGGGHIEHG